MPPSESSPDWNDLYREGETPWDKGAPSPPLLEWLESHPGSMRGRVLVPGSGLGHDVRALAAHPGLEVIGLDLSPLAVAGAEAFPKVGGERHLAGDLFELGAEHRGAYDWVWEHTCFCAIDPSLRDRYVESVHAALKPGGSLLGVFYLDPYDEDHRPGGGPPHGCRLDELEERFAGTGHFRLVESRVPGRAYPGREGLERVVWMERLPADGAKP